LISVGATQPTHDNHVFNLSQQ